MIKHNNEVTRSDQSQRAELIENFKVDIAKKSIAGLKVLSKKLNFLCLELDPYNNLDLSTEEENILAEFGIREFLNNPFEFTNIVLQLMDQVETEIKKRAH